jgi:hypothetical protein
MPAGGGSGDDAALSVVIASTMAVFLRARSKLV